MGAYLRGEKLEFQQRKYLVRTTETSPAYETESKTITSPGTSSFWSKIHPLRASSTQIRIALKDIWVGANINALNVNKVSDLNINNLSIENCSICVEKLSTTYRSEQVIKLNEFSNLFTLTFSKDTEYLYINIGINFNVQISTDTDGNPYYPSGFIALLGILKYNNEYVFLTNTAYPFIYSNGNLGDTASRLGVEGAEYTGLSAIDDVASYVDTEIMSNDALSAFLGFGTAVQILKGIGAPQEGSSTVGFVISVRDSTSIQSTISSKEIVNEIL